MRTQHKLFYKVFLPYVQLNFKLSSFKFLFSCVLNINWNEWFQLLWETALEVVCEVDSTFFKVSLKFLLLTLCFFFSFQFYLQDTKSSNGTFINSQRLSRGSEESPPCEILSGDIIQFGVDVTENTRKGMSMDQFFLLFLFISFKIY